MSILKSLFHSLTKATSKKGVYLTKSLTYRNKEQLLPPNFDYVRFATLGLCMEEIIERKVAGNMAEVGVYKGDFAKRLNQLLPDRKLYLFDTFEGFDDADVQEDKSGGYSSGDQDFSDTNIELVRRKMTTPDNCEFKVGFFPETAAGIEDQFCFVSLDADLYAPIYEGLRFFYPRLNAGGYIFIHDFNNSQYKGVREAVLRYCVENKINFTPIPDGSGTVVVTK